jgi:hypothetical protein
MNVKWLIIVLPALLMAAPLARAQDGAIVAGLSAVYTTPVGSLHNRFEGSPGGMAFIGKQISSDWTWIGKCEYFELTRINSSKLIKTVGIQEGGSARQYQVPLSKLSMKLKAVGLTAEAILNLLRLSSVETNVHVGFGFYYWDNYRSRYYDSLFVQSANSGSTIKVADLAVPENRQSDWSGSVNLGCDLDVKAVDPVWFTLGVDYKLIVGELWQALDLDMEGVSGMQCLSFRAGVRVHF